MSKKADIIVHGVKGLQIMNKHGLVSISEENMETVVHSLEEVEEALQSNTYVRATTRILQRLLTDVQRNPIILVVGREGVGKTSVINAYLREPLLCSRSEQQTKIHTFVHYGAHHHVEASFLDGVEATFELSKLELLSVSDRFAAQLLRESMDYLTVYAANDYLQPISFIDTRAFETTNEQQYYIADSILQRVDDVFYVIRADQEVEDTEITWLQQLHERLQMKPICIVNYSDRQVVNHEKITPYVRDMRYMSAKQLLQMAPKAPNDTQFIMIDDAVQDVINHTERRTQKFTRRLFMWLERFATELETVVQREPLNLSMSEEMQQAKQQIQKRNQAILEEYELEYERYSSLFEPIQTLFQFVRLIEQHDYLLTNDTILFCRVAGEYQQALREYRVKHAEYAELYEKLQKHVQTRAHGGFTMIKRLFGEKEASFDMTKQIEQLNLQRGLLDLMHERIRQLETQILSAYDDVYTVVTYTVKKRADDSLQKLSQFKAEQQREVRQLYYVTRKLEQFDGVRHAQRLVCVLIADLLIRESDFPEEQRASLQRIYERIFAVKIAQNAEDLDIEDLDDNMYNKPYAPFQPLHLSVDMLRSDYPAVPMYVKEDLS
ncbi:hypothetical protein A6M13_05560 [Caryophanon tenue]|uniref:Dynamin N-terminal domain-containing protein n=2 Tax=Caryophanon tenue TaxID=33978 RepID=A0A1C0Y6Q8_9BACL|nr:hypothetical protein A6M13_05560 [Caryophanon tenue]